jgi:myo-inositol-1(or 4)-monophosphatase
MNEIMALALDAAAKAAQIAINVRNSGNIGLNFKGDNNLCTLADIECEKAIIGLIKEKFPSHAVLSEESNSELENRNYNMPLWIIDPIDGTTNYAHGHNHVGISIAFLDKGEVQCGVVAVPFQNEVFRAVKGQGAFVNDKKIACGSTDNLKDALVCTGFPYDRKDLKEIIARLTNVLKDCRDIRRLGACSVDMCWVACGRLDIYYEDVAPWDMAAAALIVKEAGGQIGYFRNLPAINLPSDLRSDSQIVANPKLLKLVSSLLIDG